MRRVAELLAPSAELVLAAPDEALSIFDGLDDVDVYPLGEARPVADTPRSKKELARAELGLIRHACRDTDADHLWHMCSEPILRWLIAEPQLETPITLQILQPTAHYPAAFGSPLTAKQRLSGLYLERKVNRVRRREDCNHVFAGDPVAASRWQARPGAPASYLPDPQPQFPGPLPSASEREGCILFGYISPHKGVDLLADAIALAPVDLSVLIAGSLHPGFGGELERQVARMREAGAKVEVALDQHPTEADALGAIASRRCMVLPYRDHVGASQAMNEAAAVRTPVVGTSFGLVGHLIRTHGIGLAADPTDAHALRRAILDLCDDETAGRYDAAMRGYVEANGPETYARRIGEAFFTPA